MIDFTNVFGSQKVVFSAFFKAFAVIGGSIYLVYAIVLVRQTHVMLRSLEEGHPLLIRAISYMQLVFAVLLIILALLIL